MINLKTASKPSLHSLTKKKIWPIKWRNCKSLNKHSMKIWKMLRKTNAHLKNFNNCWIMETISSKAFKRWNNCIEITKAKKYLSNSFRKSLSKSWSRWKKMTMSMMRNNPLIWIHPNSLHQQEMHHCLFPDQESHYRENLVKKVRK